MLAVSLGRTPDKHVRACIDYPTVVLEINLGRKVLQSHHYVSPVSFDPSISGLLPATITVIISRQPWPDVLIRWQALNCEWLSPFFPSSLLLNHVIGIGHLREEGGTQLPQIASDCVRGDTPGVSTGSQANCSHGFCVLCWPALAAVVASRISDGGKQISVSVKGWTQRSWRKESGKLDYAPGRERKYVAMCSQETTIGHLSFMRSVRSTNQPGGVDIDPHLVCSETQLFLRSAKR